MPACPRCSLFGHGFLAVPRFGQGRASGRWFILDGCDHAVKLDDPELHKGSWRCEEEAKAAWRAEVARLQEEEAK